MDFDQIKEFILKNRYYLLVGIILITALIYLAIPKTKTVSFVFVDESGNVINKNFNFSISADGFENSFNVVDGKIIVELPKDIGTVTLTLDSKKYKLKKRVYDILPQVNVKLEKIIQKLPVTVYFNIPNKVYLVANCVNTDFETKVEGKESVTFEVPENCGQIQLAARSEDDLIANDVCDSLSCNLNFDSPSNINLADIPKSRLKVIVKDSKDNYLNDVIVKIFDVKNMQDQIDEKIINASGEFDLPVGDYLVIVNKDGFESISKEVAIVDAKEAELTVIMDKKAVADVIFSFYAKNKEMPGTVYLKDLDGNVIFTENISGSVKVPIYELKKYILEFSPNDTNYAGIHEEVNLSEKKEFIFKLKEMKTYNLAKVIIHVFDQDMRPVKNAKVFVRDALTNYDLLNYKVPVTDENGNTYVLLPRGNYVFRAYNGITESLSKNVLVMPRPAEDMLEYDVNIVLVYGYIGFNLEVYDYAGPVANAEVDFYSNGLKLGSKVTNVKGKVRYSFKVGQKVYFVVHKHNYIDYYSEARFLLPNNKWDINVNLIPDQINNNEVSFLGVFYDFGKTPVYNLEVGKDYFIGFKIKYFSPGDYLMFDFITGDSELVEKDKIEILSVYSSANKILKFRDLKDGLTEAEAKKVKLIWSDVKKGIYTVFFKVRIKNAISVRDYDHIPIKWNLFTQSDSVAEIKGKQDLVVGVPSICKENGFCYKVLIFDKQDKVYLNPIEKSSYSVEMGKDYTLEFDLINSLKGIKSQIKNGTLFIYNANTDDESYQIVESKDEENDYVQMKSIKLIGPNGEGYFNDKSKFKIFVNDFKFRNLLENRYIKGFLDFTIAKDKKSYVNYMIRDDDKKKFVNNAVLASVLFNVIKAKPLDVNIFPKVLVPNVDQNVYITVSSNKEPLANAKVLFLVKYPNSLKPVLLNNKEMYTDEKGNLIAKLNLPYGAKVKVIVEKVGYRTYNNEKYDLSVTDKFLKINKINADVVFPRDNGIYKDVEVENLTSAELSVKKVDVVFSSESNEAVHKLLAKYENYYANYNAKINPSSVTGNTKTTLKSLINFKFVESIHNLDKPVILKGKLLLHINTNVDDKDVVYEVPFEFKVNLDGYPDNAEDCLGLVFNSPVFASQGNKALTLDLSYVNNCYIERDDALNTKLIPVKFDNLELIIKAQKGDIGKINLGSFRINNYKIDATNKMKEYVVSNLVFNMPVSLGSAYSYVNDDTQPKTSTLSLTFANQGYVELKVQLVGKIRTSDGVKEVKSKESKVKIYNYNLSNCLEIVDDQDNELDVVNVSKDDVKYEDDRGIFTVNIKNNCDLDFKLKFDEIASVKNSNNVFDESLIIGITKNLIIKANETKSFKFKMPQIPGAYVLNLSAKINADNKDLEKKIGVLNNFSFVKVKTIKVNIMATDEFPIYSYNPFLTVNNDKKSSILFLYNKEVPPKDFGFIAHWTHDLMDEAWGFEDSLSYIFKKGFSAGLGVGAGYLVAAAMTGPWGMAAAVAAGVIVGVVVDAFIGDEFAQNYEQIPLNIVKDFVVKDFNYNEDVLIKDKGLIMNYTGEIYYRFYKLDFVVKGKLALAHKQKGFSHVFADVCPLGYEIDPQFIKVDEDKVDDCKLDMKYNDNWYKLINNNRGIEIAIHCNAGYGGDFDYISNFLIPCKPSNKLWKREIGNGAELGDSLRGNLKLRFNNVNLNCENDYCIKTYKIVFNNPDYGDYNVYYRVGFKNIEKNPEIPKLDAKGCFDSLGNKIGITGENAVPKLKYEWNVKNIDENFCNGIYCDATQFFTVALKRAKKATDLLNENYDFKCISYNGIYKNLNKNYSLDNNINFIALISDNEKVYLNVNLKHKFIEFSLGNLQKVKSSRVVVQAYFNGEQKNAVCKIKPIVNDDNIEILEDCNVEIADVKNLIENKMYNFNGDLILNVADFTQVSELYSIKNLDINVANYNDFCMINFPNTNAMSGQMDLLNYIVNKNDLNVFYNAQDLLNFKVNLMKDGYGEEFIKDYFKACDNFLACGQDIKNFKTLNQIAVYDYDDNSSILPLAGTYIAHIIIFYAPLDKKNAKLKLYDNNAAILIYLEPTGKISNNLFYYMPLDGYVGIDGDIVKRTNYGSIFNGAMLKITDNSDLSLLTNVKTQNANPLASVNVDTDYDFRKLNISKRGIVFELSKGAYEDNYDLFILPMFKIVKKKYFVSNDVEDKFVNLQYDLYYNNEKLSINDSLLLWFAKGKLDFDGSYLIDNYPRYAYSKDNYATIFEYQDGVKSKYELITNIYVLPNDNINIETFSSNLKLKELKSNEFEYSLNSLQEVINEIKNENMCVNYNYDSVQVFVNENR